MFNGGQGDSYMFMMATTVYNLDSTTLPDVGPTNMFDKPIVRYFSITAIIAFVALVLLVVYCAISYIGKKRVQHEDRKKYGFLRVKSSGPRRTLNTESDTSSGRQIKLMPFTYSRNETHC